MVLPLDGPGLARSLDRAVPETVITAVRVAWLPRERGDDRIRFAQSFVARREDFVDRLHLSRMDRRLRAVTRCDGGLCFRA